MVDCAQAQLSQYLMYNTYIEGVSVNRAAIITAEVTLENLGVSGYDVAICETHRCKWSMHAHGLCMMLVLILIRILSLHVFDLRLTCMPMCQS
jgi:hypothetical protein